MPSIYYLNSPPHPFWDFVAGIEDHPFFAQHQRGDVPPPMPPRPTAEQTQAQTNATGTAAASGASEKARGKQPEANIEDPPEVDPSTIRRDGKDKGMPLRGRGRFSKARNENDKDKGDDDETCRRHCGRGGHGPGHGHGPWWRNGGHPPFGPPPFMFGPDFPFGHHGPPGAEGPQGHGPGSWRGRGGFPRGGRFGPHGHHHGHGPHSRSPPRGGPFGGHRGEESGGFDLSTFLSNLGSRLGIDLTSAAEGLGLNRPRNTETDFEPRTDIFDAPSAYTVHISLPGAKKSDVGVDWDGEHSVLRVAGVVHRPGVDEEMMPQLVVDGRKRETGVFEKTIRLGTTKEPASVDVAGITAKMVDGVLVVRIPKVEKKFEKKEVHVDGSSPSPRVFAERPEDTYMNEKDLLFDAADGEDREMYDAAPAQTQPTTTRDVATEDATMNEAATVKQRKAEEEQSAARHRDDRSETIGFEHPNETTQTLPPYEVEESGNHGNVQAEDNHDSDWEKYGSDDDGEGEYVKINVD